MGSCRGTGKGRHGLFVDIIGIQRIGHTVFVFQNGGTDVVGDGKEISPGAAGGTAGHITAGVAAVHLKGRCDPFQIVGAGAGTASFTGLLQSGQQHGCKDGDDGDHNKKLDQGKAPSATGVLSDKGKTFHLLPFEIRSSDNGFIYIIYSQAGLNATENSKNTSFFT